MGTIPDLSPTEWIKSSYSNGNGGDCVEWAPSCIDAGTVPVRDSKDPHGPVLAFGPSAWVSFVAHIQR